MGKIRRIMHPTDFSKASGAAFARAVEMAKADRAELLVAHVLTPAIPMVGDGYISPKVYQEIEASAREGAPARGRPVRSHRARGEGQARGPRGDGDAWAHGARPVLPRQRRRARDRDGGLPGAHDTREVGEGA